MLLNLANFLGLLIVLIDTFAVISTNNNVAQSSVWDKDLVTTQLEFNDILDNHQQYDHSQSNKKVFSHGPTLVYVTPWNNEGYTNAELFKGKFD